MEQFKTVEKETKIKTYSKAALNSNAYNPRDEEAGRVKIWVKEFSTTLNEEIDGTEGELESLESKRSKKQADIARI